MVPSEKKFFLNEEYNALYNVSLKRTSSIFSSLINKYRVGYNVSARVGEKGGAGGGWARKRESEGASILESEVRARKRESEKAREGRENEKARKRESEKTRKRDKGEKTRKRESRRVGERDKESEITFFVKDTLSKLRITTVRW